MDLYNNYVLLILFLPLWVGLIILSGKFFKFSDNRKLTNILTILSTSIGLILSTFLFNRIKNPVDNSFLWLSTNEFNISIGTFIDSTSLIFLCILMLISLLVQIYSFSYMQDRKDYSKYFVYLNFFNFAMTGLILSPNLIQFYIFWELVGVVSYLLIGFFKENENVSTSAKRVFIINRVGDTLLLLGIIGLIYFSTNFMQQPPIEFLAFNFFEDFSNQLMGSTSVATYNILCLLLLFGAFVKSAQFPFQQWLIDAMKAPTPVSALIHSATMVCAGIFLTIRIFPLFTEELLKIILIIGLITAILCAFIAISQKNIKKMLAYSTSSQLGLMFVALGLNSTKIAIIYLVIHSFTKALLFLCTGNISKICNSIEITEISGLRKTNLYLALSWIIGGLSLSGIFFGGFTSKELLLNLSEPKSFVLFLILLTSFMSAFYISKTYFKVFEGEKKEYSILNYRSMNIPIIILSAFVIIPGFLFKLSDINMLCILSVAIGISAIFSAYYGNKCNRVPIPKELYYLSEKELFIPQFFNIIGIIFNLIYRLIYLFDKYIIDGSINLIVKTNKLLSSIISKIQNGNIQTYVSYSIFITGVILITIVYFYFKTLRG